MIVWCAIGSWKNIVNWPVSFWLLFFCQLSVLLPLSLSLHLFFHLALARSHSYCFKFVERTLLFERFSNKWVLQHARICVRARISSSLFTYYPHLFCRFGFIFIFVSFFSFSLSLPLTELCPVHLGRWLILRLLCNNTGMLSSIFAKPNSQNSFCILLRISCSKSIQRLYIASIFRMEQWKWTRKRKKPNAIFVLPNEMHSNGSKIFWSHLFFSLCAPMCVWVRTRAFLPFRLNRVRCFSFDLAFSHLTFHYYWILMVESFCKYETMIQPNTAFTCINADRPALE